MATARKTPVKRPASVSDAPRAIKRTRVARTETHVEGQAAADTRKIDGAGAVNGRKSALKRADGGKPPIDVTRDVTRAAKAARPNGAAGHARAAKANGRAADDALVPDAREGEIVRKSHVVTADAVKPVQIGGLTREAVRPDYWDRACADLMKRDRILKKLIPKFGEIHLVNLGDPFSTLARSVAGQQISTKAAQAIWERVKSACPEIHPARFIRLGHDKLQACGLSRRKAEYILDLAQHFENGALHVDAWTSMDDEAVIAELTQIRGIGRWTAEMFLIFNLSRPDVLPLDDLGLIQAISVNYFSGEPVTRSEAREVAANWEPWRTVATWYMWRSLNPIPADH